MKISIDIKTLLILTFAFILFTAIGTISHEIGHISVAQILGYNTTLHYGSMNYDKLELTSELEKIYNENKAEIENGIEFKQEAVYEKGIEKLTSNSLFITIGGPLQTCLTGIIGLTMIFWRRKKIRDYDLKLVDWIAIFLSLFWLREVFNIIMSIGRELINPNGSYFGGDEKIISESLNLPSGTVPIILGTIGILASTFIVFQIVPSRLRLTFILSGLIGGISGFIIWMNIIGPKILS